MVMPIITLAIVILAATYATLLDAPRISDYKGVYRR